MANYGFARAKKHKRKQGITICDNHNNRRKPPKHVNEDLSKFNIYKDQTTTTNEKADKRFGEVGIVPGNSLVKLLEFVGAASPEGMKKVVDAGRLPDWFQKNVQFFENEFGPENVVDYCLHVDELEPHAHICVTPIQFKTSGRFAGRNRLSATHYIGTPLKLRKFQDRYAEAMKEFGLVRGIPGSQANYQETKIWRAKNRKLDALEELEKSISQREQSVAENEKKQIESAKRLSDRDEEFSIKFNAAKSCIDKESKALKIRQAELDARQKQMEQDEINLKLLRDQLNSLMTQLQSRIENAHDVGVDYSDVEQELMEVKSKLNSSSGPGF